MNAPQSMPKLDQDVSPFAGHTRGLWIGGEWLPATGGGLIEIVDPSTEQVIDTVPDATAEDAAAAVEAAARAAKGWRETPPRRRSEILRRCFELINERSEVLAPERSPRRSLLAAPSF